MFFPGIPGMPNVASFHEVLEARVIRKIANKILHQGFFSENLFGKLISFWRGSKREAYQNPQKKSLLYYTHIALFPSIFFPNLQGHEERYTRYELNMILWAIQNLKIFLVDHVSGSLFWQGGCFFCPASCSKTMFIHIYIIRLEVIRQERDMRRCEMRENKGNQLISLKWLISYFFWSTSGQWKPCKWIIENRFPTSLL